MRRLTTKKYRLMKQKSDQDEKEKITETVKEVVKREENMSNVNEEEHQNNPSRDCLESINKE